jgi:DNA replication protein DnaC
MDARVTNTQAKRTVRGLADKLSDLEKGIARRRALQQQEDRTEREASVARFQHRWQHDRQALLEEATWTCPHCGKVLEPCVLDTANPQRPVVAGIEPAYPLWRNASQFVPNWLTPEQWASVPAERIHVARQTSCGCQGETDAQAQQEQDDPLEREMKLSRAGLVGELRDWTLESYKPRNQGERENHARVIAYTKALIEGKLGRCSFLVLHGGYGLGKSHLSAGVLHKAVKYGYSSYFRVWPEWLDALRNSFRGRGDPAQITNELKKGQVVVIDDIDKQHPTESGFPEEKLFIVLNYRVVNSMPTVLTFNRTPEEMVPWLGEAAVDRVLERAYASIPFSGVSYRSGKNWDTE